jgi:hypothetical protein
MSAVNIDTEPRAPRFTVVTPHGWSPLDLHSSTSHDAAMAAQYAELVDETLVRASLIAVPVPVDRRLIRDGHVDLDAVRALVAAPGGAIPLVDAGRVGLPAGPAVRTRSRPEVMLGDRVVRGENVQYFLPVPGGDALLVITFSTASLSHAAGLVAMFDAIAGSLEWAMS